MKNITVAFGFIIATAFSLAAAAKVPWTSFELQDNRIITQIYINDQGPYSVMFDTGATNILSQDLAAALNLNRYNRFPIAGGGENIVYATYCDVQKLEISGKTLQNNRFICMNLSDMQRAIGFPRLDGIIGYEVLAQFLTEINFDKMQITLRDFSERESLKVSGQRIPFTFHGTTPLMEASLDGVSGQFWLDTGDRASATLATPFIEKNALVEKYPPTFSTMTGYGLGGPLKTSMAFVSHFQLGGLSFTKTLIRLPTTKSPALSVPGIAGTLGMGLLRQFNIVLDYSRREMILSQNTAYTQDRSFDRSGMWISPSEMGFQILDVLEGGPAWNAGLRAHQVILSVNGVDSTKLDILKLREELKDSRTTQVMALVRDGSRTTTVSISLKNLITP